MLRPPSQIITNATADNIVYHLKSSDTAMCRSTGIYHAVNEWYQPPNKNKQPGHKLANIHFSVNWEK